MTPQEVLLKAADYIESHGWCQGEYESGGAVCMQGAINRVLSAAAVPWQEIDSFICAFLGETPERFNDTAFRTKEQVIAALREAAKQ